MEIVESVKLQLTWFEINGIMCQNCSWGPLKKISLGIRLHLQAFKLLGNLTSYCTSCFITIGESSGGLSHGDDWNFFCVGFFCFFSALFFSLCMRAGNRRAGLRSQTVLMPDSHWTMTKNTFSLGTLSPRL